MYLATSSVTSALATWMAAQRESDAASDPLFDHVARYDAPDLVRALDDLLTFDVARVALIVPSGERYTGNITPGVATIRHRLTTITVIMALRDEDYTPSTTAASTSIAEVEAVVALKDLIIQRLAATPPAAPADGLIPDNGDPLEVRDESNPDQRLWRAWISRFIVVCGAVEYSNDTFIS